MSISLKNSRIGVVGLGYVGLPLSVEFAKKYNTTGYDIDKNRISQLRRAFDHTLEISKSELNNSNLYMTVEDNDLNDCNIFIVTVPTPVDINNNPNFGPLSSASELLGKKLKKDDIIIYESTVYPGATEEICVPILEKASGLKFKHQFHVGYSPERINPGDKSKKITDIIKVTSGSSERIAKLVTDLYNSIIPAGTHMAPSIMVAEAAKVIENTQRDINIGLMNELSKIFHLMGLDTAEILKAAGTKWNFLPFKPGLVGGHCIGVDPYYLTFKARQLGFHPEMILSARSTNDNMSSFVISEFVKSLIKKRIMVSGSKILILGLTFKEDCPDMRNSKVLDLIYGLQEYDADITLSDPYYQDVKNATGLDVVPFSDINNVKFDGIILAVNHSEYVNLDKSKIRRLMNSNAILFDLKSILDASDSDWRM